jgi:hypothetical protein
MDTPQGGRARGLRPRMRLPGPDAASPALNWIGGERIAIGGVPSARLVARLAEQGVTHIVNCRSRSQVRWSGDLAAERAAFGAGRVAHAPMQDHGLRQRPASQPRCSPGSSRRECSSTAARADGARPCSPTRCSGCADTPPGRRRHSC